MCDSCGCNVTPGNLALAQQPLPQGSAIQVLGRLMAANDHAAEHNRAHFDHHQVLAVNLMSSPGSGKTTLIEHTIEALRGHYRIAVIEGDLETENDAERIRRHDVAAVQITTGSACHLDAHMVHDALHALPLDTIDLLFIENVGNLVCPASFDLGQHHDVVLLSVAEGEDKPAKYPVMFRSADLVLISKSDLAAYFDDFDPQRVRLQIRALANPAPVLSIDCRSEQGLQPWLTWLRQALDARRAAVTSTDGAGA